MELKYSKQKSKKYNPNTFCLMFFANLHPSPGMHALKLKPPDFCAGACCAGAAAGIFINYFFFWMIVVQWASKFKLIFCFW